MNVGIITVFVLVCVLYLYIFPSIYIYTDLPGFCKEDISISIDNFVLKIDAFKKECHLGEVGVNYYRRERAYGKCSRSLKLPSNINQETVSCEFLNGVLIVTLPKVSSSATHKKLLIA